MSALTTQSPAWGSGECAPQAPLRSGAAPGCPWALAPPGGYVQMLAEPEGSESAKAGHVTPGTLSWGTRATQLTAGTLGEDPLALTSPSRSHMKFSQPSSGGASGMNSQSAPEARADTRARYLEGQEGEGLQ